MPALVAAILLLLLAVAAPSRADDPLLTAAAPAAAPSTVAAPDAGIDTLLARAGALGLASDPQWLALLHVNRGGTSRDRGNSYVDDPGFFLARDGKRDFAAELDATIRALFAAGAASGDDSPACRFVARHRWLAAQFGQPPPDPRATCPAYAAWRQTVSAGSMTLVFPGSYLNSPSSMFGHTLLRIDPPAEEASTVWLSRAVSFGADTTGADGSLPYIWKGLAGGYAGYFQVEPYFTKIQHYGRMENRDLWEYPLDLDAQETAFLVDHLWELQQTRFDYYFFDENCSYRLLELLEVARPSLQLTDRWRFAEVPVNTIRSAREPGLAQAPLLRPSAERELRSRVGELTAAERELALALVADAAVAGREDFRALPRDRQALVLSAAHATMVYRARKRDGRDPVRAERSLALLRAINALGVGPTSAVQDVAAPESGHRTHRLALGAGSRADGGLQDDATRSDYAVLGVRASYHDLLDPLSGYLPGAELEMFDAELQMRAGNLRLERFDVANVFSLVPRDRFFGGWSWRVRGGLERQPMPDLDEHTARYFEGGGGLAWQAGGVLARVFIEGRIEHNGAHEHLVDAGAGPALGIVGQHARASWSLDARPLKFGDGFERAEARAAVQWHLGREWGLRAQLRWRAVEQGVAEREITDAQLVLHRYF